MHPVGRARRGGLPSGLRVATLVGLLSAVAGCRDPGAPALGTQRAPVIHGDDDRLDVYAHPSPELRALAHESIVAVMRTSALSQETDGTWSLNALTLGTRFGLCDDGTQRFLSQPTAASCSGTLVAPDIAATAGHCIEDADSCSDTFLVFDYLYSAEGALDVIEGNDVYLCDEILLREDSEGADFAFIRLDRPVAGHTPAPVARPPALAEQAVAQGDAITVLGFPSGLPLKIDDGGTVLSAPTMDTFFHTSLDTFSGSSGAGVFDTNGELVGIFAGGQTDYEPDSTGDCQVARVLPESAGRERVGAALDALAKFCAEPDADDALCEALEPLPESGGCSVTGSRGRAPAALPVFSVVLVLLGAFRQSRRSGTPRSV